MKYKFVKQSEGLLLIISAILIGGSGYLIGNINAIESNLSDIQVVYPDAIAIQSETKIEAIKSDQTITKPIDNTASTVATDKIVASQNGKRYYYPNCGGINRIKPENRIYFDTKEQAEAKGLTLASGCKSL
ncbi:MAG: hypothetical protein ACO3TG_00705 [Minisyncoccia bacterium]